MKLISQETIKPSSPTPPHLRSYVLSLVDNIIPQIPVSYVFFYKNYLIDDIKFLKNSLSQCLTQYYPFGGRFSTPSPSHIDCTDEGVEFLEVSHDNTLDEFILRKDSDEILYELLPSVTKSNSPYILVVQLNHFNDAGVALAVSVSHKVADAFTLTTFIDQWSKVTRGESPFKPTFFKWSTRHDNTKPPNEAQPKINPNEVVKYVTKSFVFPNSKLHELKMKVMRSMSSEQSPRPSDLILTRVEVLTSLLFKCSVNACTITKSGVIKQSILNHPVNMRTKIINNDPEKAVGNILWPVVVRMNDDSHEIMVNEVVDKLRKGKMEIEERDVDKISEKLSSVMQVLLGDGGMDIYWSSSFCWFPLYEVDFGWGKPIRVKHVTPKENYKYLIMMDTPDKYGIEAIVRLPEKEMMIFQHDKELVSYVDHA